MTEHHIPLCAEIDRLRARVAELEAWKESALTIENLWDVQAVGREIGVDLGEPIRSQILPYIKRLKAENKRLRAFWEWSRLADKMTFEQYHWIGKEDSHE